MSVSPAGTVSGTSEVTGTRPNTGKGISPYVSFGSSEPKKSCRGAKAGGWQKCHAPVALGTDYCIGHLRKYKPDLYKELTAK